MEGAQNVTIVDNTLLCNQPTGDTYSAVSGDSIPRPPVPLDSLIVSQNRARGRCMTLVHLAPYENKKPVVLIGAVTVTENQTKGFNFGVQFAGSILPSVKPRISDNLFEGTAPTNFVHGPPGFTFDGSNGPSP